MDSLRSDSTNDDGDLSDLSRRFLRGAPESDDVAQEAWLLLRRQEELRHRLPWLRTTMLRLSSRWRRQESGRRVRERTVARTEGMPSVVEELEVEARRQAARRLVDALPEPYREVLRLRYLEELEIEDVAVRLDRPTATVRSQIKRGLDRLREQTSTPDRRWTWVLLPWLRRFGSPERTWDVAPWIAGAVVCGGVLGLLVRSPRPDAVARDGVVSAAESTAEAFLQDGSGSASVRTPNPTDRTPIDLDPPPFEDLGEWEIETAGTVREPDGNPVANATILLQRDGQREPVEVTRSGADGRFALEADRRGLIWAELPGRGASWRRLLASRRPGQDLDLTLGRAQGSLSGHVRSADGSPLDQGWVEVICTEFEPQALEAGQDGVLQKAPLPRRVPLAPDGSFRAELPLVRPFRVLASAAGHAPLLTLVEDEGEPHLELDLVLPDPNRVAGRLSRHDGSPVANAMLELDLPNPSRWSAEAPTPSATSPSRDCRPPRTSSG